MPLSSQKQVPNVSGKTAEGPAPTNAPRVKVVGAAVAVGAAGLALLRGIG